MTDSARSPLPLSTRAQLFTQLAQMETAGLPVDKALSLLDLPGKAGPRLRAMRSLMARGSDLATAAARSGAFTPTEAQVVRAACLAGSPAASYARLAGFCARRAAQAAAIRSRLRLPLLMLIAALLIQPLPALVTGTLSGAGYCIRSLGPLIVLYLAWRLVARIQARLHASHDKYVSLDTLLLRLPLFGPMNLRRNLRDFSENLALLLEAGMPMFDALAPALDTVRNEALHAVLARMPPMLKSGSTLAQAFTRVLPELPAFDATRIVAFIETGETSGTLPEMLMRHARSESDTISSFDEQVAAWVPRLVYAAIAGWIACSLVTGAGFAPTAGSGI